ncbi:MAG: BsaWI family type II restriction enzyme [Archaeoglobaceae archaeon]
MRRGFKCKEEILKVLIEEYNKIVVREFFGDYLTAVQKFDDITEKELRRYLNPFYNTSRSLDQAWKTCKGTLYEYAVFKCLNQIIQNDTNLRDRFEIVTGDEAPAQYREQIAIKNWNEILPDADILVLGKETKQVKAIISCKTSLRERLTETAFWKRELEKSDRTRNTKIIFITSDKDEELKTEPNRYILLHVVDCTFITDPKKFNALIKHYKKKYGLREDFSKLTSKIKSIDKIKEFLETL